MNKPVSSPVHQKHTFLRGFSIQLFLFILIPAALILTLLVIVSQSIHHAAMQKLVGDRDLQAVQASAGTFSADILSIKENLLQMNLLITRPADLSNPDDLLTMLLKSNGGRVYLVTNSGIVLSFSPAAPADIAACIASLGFASRLDELKSGDVIYSDPVPFPSGALILLGTRSPAGAMLITAVPVEKVFSKALASLVRGDQTNVMIFNNRHEQIYQIGKPPQEQHYSYHPSVLKALAGEAGINYPEGTHGSHVVTYSPLQPVGWALLLDESWEDVASPSLNITQYLPLALIPLLILSLVALWLGTRQIVVPLQKLEKMAIGLGRGDYSPIHDPVGGIAEIRRLQADLESMADELEKARASLHHYAGLLTDGIEKERAGLSRELHDETLQGIIALKQRLQMEAAKDQPDEQTLIALQGMAQDSIDNLRRVLRGLRPVYLDDLGLKVALEMLAAEINEKDGIQVSFEWTGSELRFPPDVELTFYRIAQESLSNILHHSGAKHASLSVAVSGTVMKMIVEDDGHGFTVPQTADEFARQGHYGLLGMNERAELIGADLIIRSTGQGTKITLAMPA
jgi:signal transduction histidine kinase